MSVTRACKYFVEVETPPSMFNLGYFHGLAYPLDYDTEYETVMMLVDFCMNRISMEGT